ncbi:MAG: hypothetical protein U9O82_06185 [Thermodesulfobacteriota bacterium]|nr:hypothetical protein [Thermodesulfobacteriota bacterium]
MKEKINRWLRLVLGLVFLAVFIMVLHCMSISGRIPGSTGKLITRNQNEDIEVYSYVYSEIGDLEEFLDDENGKYGKAALRQSLKNY